MKSTKLLITHPSPALWAKISKELPEEQDWDAYMDSIKKEVSSPSRVPKRGKKK